MKSGPSRAARTYSGPGKVKEPRHTLRPSAGPGVGGAGRGLVRGYRAVPLRGGTRYDPLWLPGRRPAKQRRRVTSPIRWCHSSMACIGQGGLTRPRRLTRRNGVMGSWSRNGHLVGGRVWGG
jgi:hypothetical protein